MLDDELSITDVLIDSSKNLSNVLNPDVTEDNETDQTIRLPDNEYFSETDFIDLIRTANLKKADNLQILNLNIANLLSKLSSFKSFLSNLCHNGCKPDLILVVETHLTEQQQCGYNKEDLMNIVPGYKFFSRGRKEKKGVG